MKSCVDLKIKCILPSALWYFCIYGFYHLYKDVTNSVKHKGTVTKKYWELWNILNTDTMTFSFFVKRN